MGTIWSGCHDSLFGYTHFIILDFSTDYGYRGVKVMIISAIFCGLFVILTLLAFILAGNRYKLFVEDNKADFQFLFLAPASLYIIDRFNLMQLLSSQIAKIQYKVGIIYSAGKKVPQYTKMFLAQILSISLLCLVGGGVFAVLKGGSTAFLVLALVLAVLIPVLSIRKLDEKMDKRKQDIILELLEFASKVVLLVNA